MCVCVCVCACVCARACVCAYACVWGGGDVVGVSVYEWVWVKKIFVRPCWCKHISSNVLDLVLVRNHNKKISIYLDAPIDTCEMHELH